MAQYIIDIGAVPDDGQGDPLRTAFDYTNENFNQIFAAGPVLSNIQIGNNTITTTVLNSNLILSPSGIGRVQFNNTLFPRLDNVYDIGTPSLRFNSIYLGTGGIDTTGGITTSGNITASYFIGNGSQLTGIVATTGSEVVNGTSNILIPSAGSNIFVTVNGTSNVVTFANTGVYVAGTVSSTGNISGNYILGNGALLTGINIGYGNSNVASFLPTYTGNLVSLTGPVTTTANITGGNLRTTGLISATGNIIGGNVDTGRLDADSITVTGPISATGNITGGNLIGTSVVATMVSATANVTGGNIITSGLISATGNIQGGNLNVLTGTVTAGTVSASGNVRGGNLVTTGQISATGNLMAGNVDTTRLDADYITVGGYVSAVGNVYGNNFIGSSLSVTGNVSAGNVAITGSFGAAALSASGNITGGNLITSGNVIGDYFIGNGSLLTGITVSAGTSILNGNSNVAVAANGNVTISSAGVSNVLAVSGTGAYVIGIVSATGNVSGAYFIGNGAFLTGIAASYGNAEVANYLPTYTGNLVSLTGPVTTTANITGNYFIGNGSLLTGVSASDVNANALTGNTLSSNVLFSSLTSVGNLANLNVTGNATVGNVLTGGQVSASGNITGNYILGNGALLTGVITSVANINNGTSNVTVVSSGGNITVGVGGTANVAVFTTTGAYVTGEISATGNITSNYFIGNGSQLTGVTASAVNANALIGNTLSSNVLYSSLTQVGTLANLTVTGNTVGGNLLTGGLVSATGNITGGNIVTSGSGGNISGANVISGTTLSATANVVGGNINTAGVITAGGNISGNNVFATGFASVTGNVIAGNVNTSAIQPTSGALTITTASGNLNLQPVGNIVLANTFINSVAYPEQDTDAATKLYVDNMVSSALSFHAPVYAATTTDLATATSGTITYAQPNGASNGIGAYLSTTGSFDLIDTANVQTAGTRILVKNEGNAVYNGVYTWSNATAIVRSTDADQYGPNSAEQLSLNDYFFTTNGNVNAGSAFVVNEPTGTITFGTSNISFALFSQATTYTANTNAGLSLIGTQFNAKVDNNTTAFDVSGNIIVKASANLTTPNIGAATGTSLSTTGNVNSGNVNTGGLVSATGNVTGGNVLTSGLISATSNVTGGNLLTIGEVSATGNVTGNYFFGNGSQLTGVAADSVNANALVGNTLSSNVLYSSLTQVGTLANLSVAGNIAGGNILSDNYYYANGTPVPPGITYTANVAPPTSPAPKVTDQWYDTSNDVLYEFLNDGTSEYWVDTNSPAFAGGVVANVAISGNMLPVANVTFNIGNSSAYFNTAFLQTTSVAGNVVAGTVRSDTVVASVLANATAINLQTNGTNALSVDSNQYITTYRRFAASSMPLGSVVQTAMSTSLGGSITNSTSYADVSFATVTITPSSATSKILILATGTTSFTPLASANVTADTQLVRSPSVSLQIQNYGSEIAGGGVGGAGSIAYSYQDSPGTTSAVTYKLQQKISNASSTLTSTNIWLIAMEIAA